MQTWRDGRRNKRKGCQRQVGSLVRFIKGKNVSVEVKRGLTNTKLSERSFWHDWKGR